MAGIDNIFDVASRSMSAQLVRLNTIASNLANAGNISGSEDQAYRAMKPIFKTTYAANVKDSGISTTEVAGITTSERRPERIYMPNHPLSDQDGFVYAAAVNVEEEFVEMLEAKRQYQNNVEVVTTLRALMMRTINMGK
uniref:Flagellar basal-body rod protein FlgC n=1 Tax=uncultured bacterium BAC17H8 TaxID=332980 RepID=Q4JMN6_9BACT|nr:predicted flagellar proximal rod protein [uncultured bacterium BAC17H8]